MQNKYLRYVLFGIDVKYLLENLHYFKPLITCYKIHNESVLKLIVSFKLYVNNTMENEIILGKFITLDQIFY